MNVLTFHNKCVEVTQWLKKHVCNLWEFFIFLGHSNNPTLSQEWDPSWKHL